jgi:hypothetical protein
MQSLLWLRPLLNLNEDLSDLTAAVGMCVRAMDKEDMEHCDNLMKSLLEGVSCKLQQISELDSGTP